MADSFIPKYASSILLCILVALNRPDNIEAGYTMNETCAYIPKGYIGDPTNCQNWAYCEGGVLLATGTCGKGLLFDSKISMCNYASDVQCMTSTQNACKLATDPGYLSDPNNCNRYCWCSNGITTCFNCPKNQVFNPSMTKCVWSKDYQCPSDSICRLVPNNVFAGDPSRCGNYIRCQDGSGVSTPCPNGLKYNPTIGICVSDYQCNENTPSNPNKPQVPLENKAICNKNWNAKGAKTQYFSDATTCYGFYSCSSKSATGQWGSCPFATHFNPELQECVTPYSYACPYNRCGNLNLGFVAQIGCAGYTVCSNQQAVANGTCANVNEDFPWFNEYGGGCVKDKPTNQAICN